MRPALVPLMKARALIAEPTKWGQGPRSDGYGRGLCTFCAAEAIEEFVSNDAVRREAYRLVREAGGTVSLVDWNDAPERTHTEVLAAFDKAIEAAS